MSDSFLVRQRFSEDSEHQQKQLLVITNSETGDDDDDDYDEWKTLAPASSARRLSTTMPRRCHRWSPRTLKGLKDHSDDEEEITVWGNVWRFVASAALSLVLVLPLFLYSSYHSKNNDNVYNNNYYNGHLDEASIPMYPSDLLQCAHDFNVSFAQLHRQTQLAVTFCGPEEQQQQQTKECTCVNPLRPMARVPSAPQYAKNWDKTFARNIKLAAAADSPRVVLYGDSITEHWIGTDLGVPSQEVVSVKKQFDIIFDDGQALALGLAGDRSPQLYYRLMHGELPKSLDPPIFWLLIGTNDLNDNCSPESILMGILNVAQYLQDQRPQSHLVINGILPRPNPRNREWEGTRWYPSITWINQRLACYAEGMDNVEYYDSSLLFLGEDGTIPEDLMPDGLHPSGKGSRIWGEAILKRVEEILEE